MTVGTRGPAFVSVAPARRSFEGTVPTDADETVLGPLSRRLGIGYLVVATVTGFGVIVTRPLFGYPVLLLPLGMLLLAPAKALGRLRVLAPVLLLATWTVVSLAWSDSPSATFYEIRTTIFLMMAMVVVASLLPLKDLLTWQTKAFQLSLAITVVVLVVDPASRLSELVDSTPISAWKGGFLHKNGLGTFVALALPFVLAFEPRRRKWLTVVVIVVLAVGSKSLTGLIGVLLGALLWTWLGVLHRRSPQDRANIVVLTLPVVLLCILAAWSSVSVVADFYGKDLTLTGRTLIWDAAIDVAQERPVIGYGPGGLYSWPPSDETLEILNRAGFWHNHVHNGLLQVQLALGLVGLALVLALVMICLSTGITLWRQDATVSRWLITSVLVIMVMSMSERTLSGGGWLSVLALMGIVGLRARDEARARPSGHAAVPT